MNATEQMFVELNAEIYTVPAQNTLMEKTRERVTLALRQLCGNTEDGTGWYCGNLIRRASVLAHEALKANESAILLTATHPCFPIVLVNVDDLRTHRIRSREHLVNFWLDYPMTAQPLIAFEIVDNNDLPF